MDWFWNSIGWCFEQIFKLMPWMGMWFNKLLIIIGFVSFFGWLWYSSQHKEVEKFD
jgi:hypothetical protein